MSVSRDANIVNDLSTLTTVPIKILAELNAKEILCIGSAVHDAVIEGKDATVLNIGIGTLSVNIADMTCKFVPSRELKQAIRSGVAGNVDPLLNDLEQRFIDKLLSIFDEV